MINIGMDEEISSTIALLLKIQDIKKHPENETEFLNIIAIIKGILDESKSIQSDILNELLKGFDKKQSVEKFNLIKLILTDSKNLLAAPTNQFIFNAINTDDKKTKSFVSNLGEDKFIALLKNLCKISHEYLISFLSTLPTTYSASKNKYKGLNYIRLLIALFSNSNSLTVAKTYSTLFNTLLEIYNNKSVKESDRLKIYSSMLKFMYKNDKKEVKRSPFYHSTITATKNFFNDIKIETTYLSINIILTQKLLNKKYKIPKSIIRLNEVFLEHKNSKVVEDTIETYFTIINKKLLSISLYELYSLEKKKYIQSYSFLLNSLLNKYSYFDKYSIYNRLKECFNFNLFKLFEKDKESNSKVVAILFFLTLKDNTANSILHKYFMECLNVYCKNLDTLNKYLTNNLFDNDNILKPLLDNEDSKKFLVDAYIFKREQISKTERTAFLNDINTTENSESLENLKRSFVTYFSHGEISTLLDYTKQLLFTLDGTNQHNNDFLQSILSSIFYYLYLQIYLKDLSEEYTSNCLSILDIMSTLLQFDTLSRNILNYLKVILLNLYEYDMFKERVNLLTKEFFQFAYKNHRIAMKIFARFYLELCRMDNKAVSSLPDFLEYLFEGDNKLASLIFINQTLKQEKEKFNDIFFKENFQHYILNTLNNQTTQEYKAALEDIPDDDEIAREAKAKLVNLIILRYEILTYEFYLSLLTTDLKNYLKLIFNKLFKLTEKVVYEESSKKVESLFIYLNNLNINKCINIIFKFFENDISMKQKYIIRLSNIAIYSDMVVRDHFLRKLENLLNRKKISMASLSLIPICCLYFNDPDKILKKRSNQLFADYVKLLIKNYEQHKNDEITKTKIYKFLPEFILSNILLYFIFNSNLNKYYQSGHMRYFETILISYFKLMKKVSNNKYDSSLLIQNCLKIKKSNLKTQKSIKKISENTYLNQTMSKAYKEKEVNSTHYDSAKNDLSDLTIKLINTDYGTKFRHENLRTLLEQSIFTSRVSEITLNDIHKENEFMPRSEIKQHLTELQDFSPVKMDMSNTKSNIAVNDNASVHMVYLI
jgi:hypothetical protein